MRILVIGGTRFVGRHFVAEALARDHELTLLHRGRTGADLFGEAEHLLLDRDGDLGPLRDRSFDATVDVCAYLPGQVRHLAEALEGRGGQHVYVSSVSAYAPMTRSGLDETAPLHPAPDPPTETIDNETYGPLKAECERVAGEAYGDALTVVRPSYVVGPHDPTGRFPWWVDRIARGGHVLAPGPAGAPFQAVDGRDLAVLMAELLETRTTGDFHAAGPRPPYSFGDLLGDIASAVAPEGTHLEWVDAAWLTERGVDGGALPLWDEGGEDHELAVDPGRAYAHGLEPRSFVDTARDTLAWLRDGGSAGPERALDPAREEELLAEWAGRG
jgi:2'-hydroxyisoflavone reductase